MDLLALFNIDHTAELMWVLLGFAAQMMFGMRFVVQWWRSERAGRSVVPLSFWYFSTVGGIMMLAYAIYRWDPVFMFGQALGLTIYLRNLVLIHRSNEADTQVETR